MQSSILQCNGKLLWAPWPRHCSCPKSPMNIEWPSLLLQRAMLLLAGMRRRLFSSANLEEIKQFHIKALSFLASSKSLLKTLACQELGPYHLQNTHLAFGTLVWFGLPVLATCLPFQFFCP